MGYRWQFLVYSPRHGRQPFGGDDSFHNSWKRNRPRKSLFKWDTESDIFGHIHGLTPRISSFIFHDHLVLAETNRYRTSPELFRASLSASLCPLCTGGPIPPHLTYIL